LTEESRAVGVGAAGGVESCAGFKVDCNLEVPSAGNADAFWGIWDALNPSVDGSTCCGVELKYLARIGRRKIGGRTAEGIRVSSMDFLTVLLSMLALNLVPDIRMLTSRQAAIISSFFKTWMTNLH
jgi:hypothetical protein